LSWESNGIIFFMEDLSPNIGEEKKGFAEEKTSSPEVYIDRFLKSDLFLKGRHNDVMGSHDLRGYNDFIEELKTRKVDASNEEIMRVFLDMNETKLLFLHFAKYELMFEYDKQAFCEDNNTVCREFGEYEALIKNNNSERARLDLNSLPVEIRKTRIVEMDAERQYRHNQTLNALFDGGYVPSKMIGRAMARIMLISEGLDTFERALSDEENRYRMLAGVGGKIK